MADQEDPIVTLSEAAAEVVDELCRLRQDADRVKSALADKVSLSTAYRAGFIAEKAAQEIEHLRGRIREYAAAVSELRTRDVQRKVSDWINASEGNVTQEQIAAAQLDELESWDAWHSVLARLIGEGSRG